MSETERIDWETVEEALRRYKALAQQFEYSGMGGDLRLAKKALRIVRQRFHPTLPGMEDLA